MSDARWWLPLISNHLSPHPRLSREFRSSPGVQQRGTTGLRSSPRRLASPNFSCARSNPPRVQPYSRAPVPSERQLGIDQSQCPPQANLHLSSTSRYRSLHFAFALSLAVSRFIKIWMTPSSMTRKSIHSEADVTITGFNVIDLRFPTSLDGVGSDAMHVGTNGSHPYIQLRTNHSGFIGEGIVCNASWQRSPSTDLL